MRVKTAPCLRPQLAPLLQHTFAPTSASVAKGIVAKPSADKSEFTRFKPIKSNKGLYHSQQGATVWLMALFIVAILVTAIVAMMLGHKFGYQRGYYSLKKETEQAAVSNAQASNELKDLRLSHKILTNQAQTAKQELEISLANLAELRRDHQTLKVENRQVMQLNNLYEKVIAEQGGMALQILGAKIKPLPENAFEYGFDVAMLGEDNQTKSLKATLVLQNKDSFVEVPLDPERYSIKGVVRIRGRFMMPSGFEPLQVKLNLEAGDEQVEQLYDWQLGDRVDSMPLALSDLPEVDQNPITP